MTGIIEAPDVARLERSPWAAHFWVVELNVPGFRIVRWAQKRRHLLLGSPALPPHPAEAR